MSGKPIISKPLRAPRELTLSDPFRDVENQFWELFARPARALLQVPDIKVDISEDEESKSGKTLISSERASRQYRAFTLTHDIDSDKAEAKYLDGVLDLTLPRKPGAKTTDVQVK